MTPITSRLCQAAMIAVALTLPCVVVAQDAVKDRSKWANADPERKKWFESQMMNEATRQRLNVQYRSCCDAGDVFRTRFRVIDDGTKYGTERWQYLDDKTGDWKTIHPDIIKDEKSIDDEPILFRNKHDGRELCFFPPKGGT